jgi:hypothetical protein
MRHLTPSYGAHKATQPHILGAASQEVTSVPLAGLAMFLGEEETQTLHDVFVDHVEVPR